MNYKIIERIDKALKKKEGGEKKYKFVQALVHPDTHKALKRFALEQDITLGELLQEVIEFYLIKKVL